MAEVADELALRLGESVGHGAGDGVGKGEVAGKLVDDGALGTVPAGDGGGEGLAQRREGLGDGGEDMAAHDHDLHRGAGPDGGGARPVVDQRRLAEEIARAERGDDLAGGLLGRGPHDFHLALLDDVKARRRLALLDDVVPGLEVGVRTNLDVLNAQQQVTQVQRDLAQARYNALLSDIKLRAATGVLSEDDIRATNAYLTD